MFKDLNVGLIKESKEVVFTFCIIYAFSFVLCMEVNRLKPEYTCIFCDLFANCLIFIF